MLNYYLVIMPFYFIICCYVFISLRDIEGKEHYLTRRAAIAILWTPVWPVTLLVLGLWFLTEASLTVYPLEKKTDE